MTQSTQVRLAARPSGLPVDSDWNITHGDLPTIKDGEILIEVSHISLDPAMRGWVRQARSYIEPVKLGDVMRAGAVGKVIESMNSQFAVGEHVFGMLGVQTHAVSNGKRLNKIMPSLAPVSAFLGAIGMPGLTAYFGLLDVGELKPGDTVLISGAAGAVGAVAGQVARLKGAGRVVGIAGTEAKCTYLVKDLGFDAAINYRTEDVAKQIRATCPKGVDLFFDNVGGDILDSALANISQGARVVICGAISQYNAGSVQGPSNYLALLVKRAKMQGFVVFDYQARYPEGFAELAGWLAAGRLTYRETIIDGIENFPRALLRLFSGKKEGKLVIKV